MERQEFELLLESVYNAGYEQAELDAMQESNKETKARNREIGNKAIEKRFYPVRFTDKKDDEENQKTHKAMHTGFIDQNPSLIRRDENGRVKNVASLRYGKDKNTRDYNLKNDPYLDRTNAMIGTNKMLKDIKDPKERKEKINKAKEIFKRLQEKRKNNA